MRTRIQWLTSLAAILAAPSAAMAAAAPPRDDAVAIDFFERKVRPVLVENCDNCHSANTNTRGACGSTTALACSKGEAAGPPSSPATPPKASGSRPSPTATAPRNGPDGRDHNINGYPMWLAGAGVKPGFSHGATDEYGLNAVEGRLHTTGLHATLLALMGLDHEALTYRYAGRDFRLTDVAGNVAREIFA